MADDSKSPNSGLTLTRDTRPTAKGALSVRVLLAFLAVALVGCLANVASTQSSAPASTGSRSSTPSDCGVDYPTEFPCLSGGEPLPRPERTPFPGVRIVAAIHYKVPAPDLAKRLIDAAVDMDCTVNQTEVSPEPSGARYRSKFSCAGRDLSTSVWPAESGSVLQIMTFGGN